MRLHRSQSIFLFAVALPLVTVAAAWSGAAGAALGGPPVQGDAGAQSDGAPTQLPRDVYVLSTDCAANLLGDECGARVPELSWANVIQMCSEESQGAGDSACQTLRPALPDCEAQGIACFSNIEREQIVGALGDLCGADPAAPGCSSLQRGGEGCVDSPACSTQVASNACAEGGGGICPSLENTLTGFGRNAPQVDRAPQAGADAAGDAGLPIAYLADTGLSAGGDSPQLRAVIFSPAGAADHAVAVDTPPGLTSWQAAESLRFRSPRVTGTDVPYLTAMWAQVESSDSTGGAPSTLDAETFAGGQELQLRYRTLNLNTLRWEDGGAVLDGGDALPGRNTGFGGTAPYPVFRNDAGTIYYHYTDASLVTDGPTPGTAGVAEFLAGPFFEAPDPSAGAGDTEPGVGFGASPIENPSPFIFVPGGRDPTVQLMMVAQITVVAPGRDDVPPPVVPEPASLWSAIRRVFSFRGLSASVSDGGPAWRPSAAGAQRVAPRPAGTAASADSTGGAERTLSGAAPSNGAGQQSPLRMFLTNLGSSTGEAFTGHFVNDSTDPLELDVRGLVVEPLNEQAQQVVREQLEQALPRNPLSAQLNAYCLEFLRLPPLAEQMFQLAPREAQEQFAPTRDVLEAAEQLSEMGLLPADSDPEAYFHSITQWAVWTEQQGFNEAAFTDAFVGHTRDQVEAAGNQWTDQFDEVLRGAAPARWQNITRILETAANR